MNNKSKELTTCIESLKPAFNDNELSSEKQRFIALLDAYGMFQDPHAGRELLTAVTQMPDAQAKSCTYIMRDAPPYLFYDLDKVLRIQTLMDYIKKHADPEKPHEFLSAATIRLKANIAIADRNGIMTRDQNLYFDAMLAGRELPRLLDERNTKGIDRLKSIYQSLEAPSWRAEARQGRRLTATVLDNLEHLTPDASFAAKSEAGSTHVATAYKKDLESIRSGSTTPSISGEEPSEPETPRTPK